MKMLFATAVLLCSAGAMAGETATINSNIRSVNSIAVPTGPSTMAGANFSEGDAQIAYSSGQKATQKFKCASWSTAPGSGFSVDGVCEFTEGTNDKGSLQFACTSDEKTRSSDCWGGVRGTAGRFAGKTGNITWHQVDSADGKTGTAQGVSMWND